MCRNNVEIVCEKKEMKINTKEIKKYIKGVHAIYIWVYNNNM
jgi:hypothetical protein